MKESFVTVKPNLPNLQKLIAYYYFHSSTEENYTSKFTYYPNVKNALTIYRNSEIILDSDYNTKANPSKEKYFFTYTKLIHQFASAEIHAPFDKIGIVFQPLGINHFIDQNLSELVKNTFNLNFRYFQESMTPFLNQIYSINNMADKARHLDEYFNSIYCGFEEVKLERALVLLDDKIVKYTVQSLAKELNISRKTLLRLFNKHLCCSVKDYLNVVHFRRALNIYNSYKDKSVLVNLALDAEYYDQSQFINHFKKLTGFNPKKFFKKIAQFGEEGTF